MLWAVHHLCGMYIYIYIYTLCNASYNYMWNESSVLSGKMMKCKYSRAVCKLTSAMRHAVSLFTSVSCRSCWYIVHSGWKCKSVLVLVQKSLETVPLYLRKLLATQNDSIVFSTSYIHIYPLSVTTHSSPTSNIHFMPNNCVVTYMSIKYINLSVFSQLHGYSSLMEMAIKNFKQH